MNKIEVIGLGALNLDHIYRVENIIADGETVVNEAVLSPGGSSANTIYGLAKLGVATGFSGVIGDDPEGRLLLQDFQKAGTDTTQIRLKPGARTGSTLCLSDKPGNRSLYVIPGANNQLGWDDLDLSYLNQAGIIHLSSFAGDRQFKISLELMDRLDSSIKLSFTPGALYSRRGLKALAPILKRTYLLFINHNELQQLTGEDVITGAETCLKQGCHIIVVTLGKGVKLKSGRRSNRSTVNASCYIRDADSEYVIEPPGRGAGAEIDTTGAGDAFAAGLLYGLFKDKGLEECGRLGNIVAQFSVTRAGAREGLPTVDELSDRYRELYSQQP